MVVLIHLDYTAVDFAVDQLKRALLEAGSMLGQLEQLRREHRNLDRDISAREAALAGERWTPRLTWNAGVALPSEMREWVSDLTSDLERCLRSDMP